MSSGVWYQSDAGKAIPANGYPEGSAGRLQIVKGGDSVGQMYTRADGTKIFIRGYEAGTWGPWTELVTPVSLAVKADTTYVNAQIATRAPSSHTHSWSDITNPPATYVPSPHGHAGTDITSGTVNAARLPVSTQTTAGTMSAADKKKLDLATAVDTPSTVMMRDSAGRARVDNPAGSMDIANKGYVDAQVAKLPPASATGVLAIASMAPGASIVNINISFPAGRFTATPFITFGSDNSRVSCGYSNVSTSGFTLTVANWTSVTSPLSEIVWTATQI